MKNAKHTPGPWEADQHPGSREVYIRPVYKGYGKDYPALAESFSQDSSPEEETIQWANAHLIAAAPELLEACCFAAKTFVIRGVDIPDCIITAISKAEGRQ